MAGAASRTVAGVVVEPGHRAAVPVPVTTGLNGAPLRQWVHVVHGREPGPTLALICTLHGEEWFSIGALRQLVAETDPAGLRGTLLVVPVANPPALGMQSRDTPHDGADSPDMNRVFPGTHTWRTDQLARALTDHVLAGADALLDFHMGPWGSAFTDILIGDDYPDPAVVTRSQELALAFGSPIIRRADIVGRFPGPRSSIGYAGAVLGIPALGVEVGGAGFAPELENAWRKSTVDGVRAVMAELDMVDAAPPVRPQRQLVYRTGHRVNPTVGGVLRSRYGGDKLATAVTAGTVLGEVVSPYTFEVLEELVAPVDGLLFYTARDHPLHPGSWAFGIAQTTGSDVTWIENAGGPR